MSTTRPYFTSNQLGRDALYDNVTDGGILSSMRDNVYFYTMCAAGALVAIYVLFYVLRQYEYSFVYNTMFDKIAKYLPGVKKAKTIKSN